jgi:hypothetical protein
MGRDHDGPEKEVSRGTNLGEANANANGERGDKQSQPKTFFRRLDYVTGREETKEEGCR